SWRKTPLRKHGKIYREIDGERSSLPMLYPDSKNSIAGHLSSTGKLAAAWDWQFSLDGTFGKNRRTCSTAFGFGRKI
ncbi:MAG: hypothetical protein LBB38_01795, partial [Puniceicoccales bacterium]|nr:hypothetical protein [Puniceicoccales bacterium]